MARGPVRFGLSGFFFAESLGVLGFKVIMYSGPFWVCDLSLNKP